LCPEFRAALKRTGFKNWTIFRLIPTRNLGKLIAPFFQIKAAKAKLAAAAGSDGTVLPLLVDRGRISDLSSGGFSPRNLMRSWFSCFLAAALCTVCLIPASTSAYYYGGRYYPYRYHGHYYRYYYRGHYYQYHYQGRYYRHRAWVVGSNGRPGYYRYW
jgi:hypothetical protein